MLHQSHLGLDHLDARGPQLLDVVEDDVPVPLEGGAVPERGDPLAGGGRRSDRRNISPAISAIRDRSRSTSRICSVSRSSILARRSSATEAS